MECVEGVLAPVLGEQEQGKNSVGVPRLDHWVGRGITLAVLAAAQVDGILLDGHEPLVISVEQSKSQTLVHII
jgi:hypothetical protein